MTYTLDTSAWHWPQYLFLSLIVFQLVVTAILDGEPRSQKTYSFSTTLFNAIFTLTILFAGGFFS